MLAKEKLAAAARDEVRGHIILNPVKWADEIAADMDNKDEFIRDVIGGLESGHVSKAVWAAVHSYAEKAGQQAYDSVIGHPGNI